MREQPAFQTNVQIWLRPAKNLAMPKVTSGQVNRIAKILRPPAEKNSPQAKKSRQSCLSCQKKNRIQSSERTANLNESTWMEKLLAREPC